MKTLLVAAGIFFAFSAAAFAQATFSVGSIPVTAVVKSGLTEKTGDITFTQISGTSTSGTITITYGVPITIDIATKVSVIGSGIGSSVNAPASSNSAGVLVINVVAGSAVAGNTITVSGVRVAVAGTALTTLNASISSTGNAIVAGQTNVTVINSIAAAIASLTLDPTAGGRISAVSGAVTPCTTCPLTGAVTIKVKEGFLTAFGVTASTDPTQTSATMVRITLSAAPPKGVTISFPPDAGSDGTAFFTRAGSTGTLASGPLDITSTSTSLGVYYKLTTNSNLTKQETMSIVVTISVSDSGPFPLPAAALNITATFAQIGTAFDSSGNVLTGSDGNIPRYVAEETAAATLVSILGANTTLLIPYASKVTSGGFDTGIAISNSTTDPGTNAMGATGATKQTGTLTFYFFPQLPSPSGTLPASFTYTTSGTSPGTGLDSTGKLPSGSTYSVLLGQLLTAASAPADFAGYIIVIANFTNAHCLYVLSNFTTFSQGSLALVISSGRAGLVEALDN